jgi:hypothetical protein
MFAGNDFEEVMRALDNIIRAPAWYAEAACRGMGERLFFSARGEPADEARAVRERPERDARSIFNRARST